MNGHDCKMLIAYLESTPSRAAHIDDKELLKNCKIQCGILPILLYACETWSIYQRNAKIFNNFRKSCQSRLLNIRWEDKVQDAEVIQKEGMQSVYTRLKLAQLRYADNVNGMPDKRLPKKVFF